MPKCAHLKSVLLPLKENIPEKDRDCVQNTCKAENITKYSLKEIETPVVCAPSDQIRHLVTKITL